MFGIKIIKDFEYNQLIKCQKDFNSTTNELREEIYQLAKDNASLRVQLNKMIMDVHRENQKENISSLSNLHDLCIIKNKNYLCDKCKFVNTDCKKLEFANQTICVCGKSDIELYK